MFVWGLVISLLLLIGVTAENSNNNNNGQVENFILCSLLIIPCQLVALITGLEESQPHGPSITSLKNAYINPLEC